MKFSNESYDRIKYFALIFLPALSVLLGTVLPEFGCTFTNVIVAVVNAFGVFLGAIIKESSDHYNGISD